MVGGRLDSKKTVHFPGRGVLERPRCLAASFKEKRQKKGKGSQLHRTKKKRANASTSTSTLKRAGKGLSWQGGSQRKRSSSGRRGRCRTPVGDLEQNGKMRKRDRPAVSVGKVSWSWAWRYELAGGYSYNRAALRLRTVTEQAFLRARKGASPIRTFLKLKGGASPCVHRRLQEREVGGVGGDNLRMGECNTGGENDHPSARKFH